MTGTIEPRTAACRRAIAALPFVGAGEGGGFSFELPGGRRMRLRLHVGESWADLTVEPGEESAPTGHWDALALNAAAGGMARLILRPGDSTVALRADVRLAADEDPSPRLAEACSDLRRLAESAGRFARRSNADAGTARTQEAEGAAARQHAGADVAALLTEAGWPFVQRASHRLAVDLGLPEQFQQAFITNGPGGRCNARATLAVIGAPTVATRNALGVLLLTVSALVRTVRGGCVDEGGESAVFFEAPLGEAPDASDVDAALGAVAMACQLAGRESRALIDERIARAYLAARGWAA
jgi:hypothetical protein